MKKPVPKTVQPFQYDELKLGEMLTFLGVALRRGGVPVFKMEDRLVYSFRWEQPSSGNDPDDKIRHDDDALMVETLGDGKLHEYIIEHAPFFEMLPGGKNQPAVPTPIAPPRSLTNDFLEAKDHWRFRTLKGLIQAPTLRADGTVLKDEGYDRASGLYLDTNGVKFPDIPDKPSREDALKALAILKEPFSEFPWEVQDHFGDQVSPSRSVILSAVLTGLIRRTLDFAPLHIVDAPEAGSGKGLACSVATIIITGNRATAITFGDNEAEFRKMLFAALLANTAVITFDNLTRPLQFPSLNSALTESTLTDRILSVSQNATVPTNALFLANGNNVRVKGDMHRRVIAARLDAGERPEERIFKRKKLVEWTKANRPRFVAAALTILRAYQVAGYPGADALTPYGSFEEWSKRVRGALVWLGEADPCMTREAYRDAEPEREGLGNVIRALTPISKGKWRKSADAMAAGDFGSDLYAALEAAEVTPDAKGLGEYLRKNKGRTIDGLRLEISKDSHSKMMLFRIVDTKAKG